MIKTVSRFRDYVIRKNPKKDYVIDFSRALGAFLSELSVTSFKASSYGSDLYSRLKGIEYELLERFPYLGKDDA